MHTIPASRPEAQPTPVFPFGKFKGTPLPRLPGWYVSWAVKIVTSSWLKNALTEELERRAGPIAAGPTPRPRVGAAPLAGRPIPTPTPEEIDW